ncbi:MAG TPA: phosphatase PAP2 family protein [Campylobacterales bacterium]|nr:phosphatase PAP2 family protein [Campylobacterales bacterium]
MLQPKYLFFFAVTVALVVVLYLFADREIATYFDTLDNPDIRHFFKSITHLGKSEWYLIPSILLFWYFRKKEHYEYATMALYVFVTNVVAGLGVWLFKIPFGRMRPEFYLDEGRYGFEWFEIDADYASFPSGHTITIVSTVVALSLLFPRLKYLLLPVGAVIAFSRVAVTAHYLSDVIFASFLGTMVAIALHRYYFKSKEL